MSDVDHMSLVLGFDTDELRRLAASEHDFTDAVRAELLRREHLAAEALFTTNLQPSDHPDHDALVDAIDAAIRDQGCDGCANQVALEYGDHPDTAPARMRWCLACEQQLVRDGHALASGGA